MVIPIAVAVLVILVGLVYKAIKPPAPKICGSIGGPQVTSPRVKLSDGRNLAYREFGVPKEEARHKIIVIHGYNGFKDQILPVSQVCFNCLLFFYVVTLHYITLLCLVYKYRLIYVKFVVFALVYRNLLRILGYISSTLTGQVMVKVIHIHHVL